MQSDATSFDEVKARLDEIVDQISSDEISLDESLALYEEAVRLGLAACDLSETDISAPDEGSADAGDEGSADAGDEGSAGINGEGTTAASSANSTCDANASDDSASAEATSHLQAAPDDGQTDDERA